MTIALVFMIISSMILPTQQQDDLPVRLASGPNADEGRVEIFYNNAWGNIYSLNWPYEYASVICRQLGYKYTLAAVQEGYYKGKIDVRSETGALQYYQNVPGHTKDVHCIGNEARLADCEITFSPSSDGADGPRGVRCSNYEPSQDLGVRLVHGEDRSEGMVQVFHNNTWGYICDVDQHWNLDAAKAVCRELGYIDKRGEYFDEVMNRAGAHIPPEDQRNFFLDSVDCDGFESRLADCKHSAIGQYECPPSHFAGVTCIRPPYALFVRTLRLVGGDEASEGYVQAYVGDSSSDWYFVCKDTNEDVESIDMADMHVLCHQLGFGYALAPPTSHSFSNPTSVSEGLKLALSLNCNGLENDISNCKDSSSFNTLFCTTTDNLAIRCSNNSTRSQVGKTVRIVEREENPVSGQGHVEVFYDDKWWKISKYGWDIRDANVVCRQLGYTLARSTGLSYYSSPLSRQEAFILIDVDCKGSENSLHECNNTEVNLWSDYYYATINCINSSRPLNDGDIQLVGSPYEDEGRIQIYSDSKWWTICDNSWDLNDAFVVGRQLGYKSVREEFGVVENDWIGPTSDDVQVLMSGFSCRGNEENLLECAYPLSSNQQCTHGNDVGVRLSHDDKAPIEIPDVLKCVKCQNHVSKIDGEMVDLSNQQNNMDCKNASDKYLNGETCDIGEWPYETAHCAFTEVTISGKLQGKDVEYNIQSRGCINYQQDQAKKGCLKEDAVEKLMRNFSSQIDNAEVKGHACICNDKDNCNSQLCMCSDSAVAVHSVVLFGIALIALVALY